MQSIDELNRQLEKAGKADKLRALADSPEGQRVGQLVNGDALAEAARSGDAQALRDMLSSVLNTDEGRRLAENVRKMMER